LLLRFLSSVLISNAIRVQSELSEIRPAVPRGSEPLKYGGKEATSKRLETSRFSATLAHLDLKWLLSLFSLFYVPATGIKARAGRRPCAVAWRRPVVGRGVSPSSQKLLPGDTRNGSRVQRKHKGWCREKLLRLGSRVGRATAAPLLSFISTATPFSQNSKCNEAASTGDGRPIITAPKWYAGTYESNPQVLAPVHPEFAEWQIVAAVSAPKAASARASCLSVSLHFLWRGTAELRVREAARRRDGRIGRLQFGHFHGWLRVHRFRKWVQLRRFRDRPTAPNSFICMRHATCRMPRNAFTVR